jgi:hypothetical protein
LRLGFRRNFLSVLHPTENFFGILMSTRLRHLRPNFLWWSWWHVVLTSPEGLLIPYKSGIFAIDTSIVNFQTCPRHRDALGVYWKRQKRTYRSPHSAKTSKSCAKCSRLQLQSGYLVTSASRHPTKDYIVYLHACTAEPQSLKEKHIYTVQVYGSLEYSLDCHLECVQVRDGYHRRW